MGEIVSIQPERKFSSVDQVKQWLNKKNDITEILVICMDTEGLIHWGNSNIGDSLYTVGYLEFIKRKVTDNGWATEE